MTSKIILLLAVLSVSNYASAILPATTSVSQATHRGYRTYAGILKGFGLTYPGSTTVSKTTRRYGGLLGGYGYGLPSAGYGYGYGLPLAGYGGLYGGYGGLYGGWGYPVGAVGAYGGLLGGYGYGLPLGGYGGFFGGYGAPYAGYGYGVLLGPVGPIATSVSQTTHH
uniref:Suckerin-5 n=1 Tax=Dosidicus gigas TaxID=346249 RepID=A0A081DU76_DOSGI